MRRVDHRTNALPTNQRTKPLIGVCWRTKKKSITVKLTSQLLQLMRDFSHKQRAKKQWLAQVPRFRSCHLGRERESLQRDRAGQRVVQSGSLATQIRNCDFVKIQRGSRRKTQRSQH